jgi:glycosyltransferase involved in cell wall biosynthesis
MKKRKKNGYTSLRANQAQPKNQIGRSPDEVSYHEACQLAEHGKLDQARSIYESLVKKTADNRVKALACNDLGVLAAGAGNIEAARNGFLSALEIDLRCEPAKANLALLESETLQPLAPSAPIRREGDLDPPVPENRRVRVAIVSFLFNWPSTGGGIVHTIELAKFLVKAGYEVSHFYPCFPAWGVGKVETHLPFPSKPLDFDDSNWTVSKIQERFGLAVRNFEPDHVIITDSWNSKPILAEAVRGYPYILRFQAMECLCPLNNVRLICEKGGSFRQCNFHQLATPQACRECLIDRGSYSGTLHQAERALCQVGTTQYYNSLLRAIREAEAVLVVNPLHEVMISPYSDRVRVVTAGMDPARFPWPKSEKALQNPKEKKAIFFAGLVEESIKGFPILHEACRQLWQNRQDFELVATGDPPGQLDQFTRYIGWQTQEDLPRHLMNVEVLAIPTIAQEALGRTAVEAMAAGIPVVASRLGGLPFTVTDGATGLLFEPGDSGDLATKIATLLDDEVLRRRLGLAGRRRFEEHYSWDKIIDRHYRPLLDALGDRMPFVPLLADGRKGLQSYPSPS